jgi:hypothetical protein
VVNKLFSTTLYFWAAWITRTTGTWNFTDYLIIMAAPAVVYLQANVLVAPSPHEVEDWRAHYYKN